MAEITRHVAKLRKALLDISEKDNAKAKNPFTFWYSPRTNDMSCHLLGHHVTGEDLDDLLDNAELKVCEIYNTLYESSCISLDQLFYDDEPEKWSQERLMREFKKLKEKVSMKRKTRKPRANKNEAK
jgi:hypothetical protein